MGTCCFADDIHVVLLGESEGELKSILNVVSEYARRWKLRFNASKCGVSGEKEKWEAMALG